MQCPHCLQHFHERSTYTAIAQNIDQLWWIVSHTQCAACEQSIIDLGKTSSVHAGPQGPVVVVSSILPSRMMVYPRTISRSPIPSEVPPEFTADYAEACRVLPDSEKASAALSRRCLQQLLREKVVVKKDDLSKEIQQVLDSHQLPSYLADDLDAIRNIGNFGTHPIKSQHTGEIVDVEPGEAEWSLDVLEGLFDFYFVQPMRAKAKRDALDAKLLAMAKPPMKSP